MHRVGAHKKFGPGFLGHSYKAKATCMLMRTNGRTEIGSAYQIHIMNIISKHMGFRRNSLTYINLCCIIYVLVKEHMLINIPPLVFV